ncbi:hypothetical protein CcCBS67573_g01266 [Chytriomyces confervae]|uniref:Acyl-CoA desaturase n=1 Tax=Chytriomyces confervae TaxID=246404 RepID=A0A507FR66_9FUNG|nr:hypothetical protein HDU80_000975 [Chytriomyces hyalinus]TPX77487.1 hypothetical protein CcCBS67573_g01266 [Chytriomyces confervae]
METAAFTAHSQFRLSDLEAIEWHNVVILFFTPVLAVKGLLLVPLQTATFWWAVAYYFFTGLGITAGYHRYWSHRSYQATRPFQMALLLAGTGALEGSVKWWCRGHRVHHRFTDTEKDPYNAKNGFFWSHIGWMIVKQEKKAAMDISDLNSDPMIQFQHDYYLPLGIIAAFVIPTVVAGLGWGDWMGGFFYAGVARLVFVHHSTFCVNSLAHYLGERTFDDKRTPSDHVITALITLGEGYHNFHHEFPSDYRNAIELHQYDPTKWLIWSASLFGLTYNLKMFPSNEIEKGRIDMQQKGVDAKSKELDWGVPLQNLPNMTIDEVKQKVAETEIKLIVISNIVYDVTNFMDEHPGGKAFLKISIGKDATAAFNGGVYDHANAARNLMSSMRYATLVGSGGDGVSPDDE